MYLNFSKVSHIENRKNKYYLLPPIRLDQLIPYGRFLYPVRKALPPPKIWYLDGGWIGAKI